MKLNLWFLAISACLLACAAGWSLVFVPWYESVGLLLISLGLGTYVDLNKGKV